MPDTRFCLSWYLCCYIGLIGNRIDCIAALTFDVWNRYDDFFGSKEKGLGEKKNKLLKVKDMDIDENIDDGDDMVDDDEDLDDQVGEISQA